MDNVDLDATYFVYRAVNSNDFTRQMPFYFGLLPYELYVIPTFYLALVLVIWFGTPNPIIFHIAPHLMAFSIFGLLKRAVKRPRPGCFHKDLSHFIDASHCSKSHRWQSWPSGHTGVGMALATALWLEMKYSKHARFLEIPVESNWAKSTITGIGFFVAGMTALQRISKGYHTVFDTISGGLLGFGLGFATWHALHYFRGKHTEMCETIPKDSEAFHDHCDLFRAEEEGRELPDYWAKHWSLFSIKGGNDKAMGIIMGVLRLVLSIPLLMLIYKFFAKDLWKLRALKH